MIKLNLPKHYRKHNKCAIYHCHYNFVLAMLSILSKSNLIDKTTGLLTRHKKYAVGLEMNENTENPFLVHEIISSSSIILHSFA